MENAAVQGAEVQGPRTVEMRCGALPAQGRLLSARCSVFHLPLAVTWKRNSVGILVPSQPHVLAPFLFTLVCSEVWPRKKCCQ